MASGRYGSCCGRDAELLDHPKPMNPLTPEEEDVNCQICEQLFEEEEERVRDHCHLTGRFRNPVYSKCHLGYQLPYYVPVVLHNLQNIGSHFLIKEFAWE